MTSYRQPMKNNGLLLDKNEKEVREMSSDDVFDLIASSFIVGVLVGAAVVVLCLINYI